MTEQHPQRLLDQVRDAAPGDGVARTMIYTHVLQRGGLAVRSPLD